MQYTKPHLSFEEQADLLIARGLPADSKQDIVERLKAVSYYRLSTYWYPFRQARGEMLESGITIDKIWDHYIFDRQLRFLLMDAIERVEVSIRTRLVYAITASRGAFGYVEPSVFYQSDDHAEWLKRFRECVQRGKESSPCLKHFFAKYGNCHSDAPFWIGAESMDYGCLSRLFRSIEVSLRNNTIDGMGLTYDVMKTWMRSFNSVRNSCAHHEYVWDRAWKNAPKTPDKVKEWRDFPSDKTGVLLMMCRHLLRRVAPSSEWHLRVEALFTRFADNGIDFSKVGLPADWQDHPLWK